MRISLNWLNRLIDLKKSPEEISITLTNLGLEVESIEDNRTKYNNFVVGKILEVNKHPNADKLSVCKVQVNRGEEKNPIQIVCGAANVKKNQKVAVGLIGAIVPKNQYDVEGKPFELIKLSIRGIESNGMICSEYELDLGSDSNGIMILDNKCQVGTKLSHYYGVEDIIFEIGVTPNRADCLSHLGIARELAFFYKKDLKNTSKINFKKVSKYLDKRISVEIVDEEFCPRYSALVIKDVEICESPKWIQSLLISAGVRPINSIVDITNFVMLEIGQPMHAFDYEKIAGSKIKIQTAYELEHFFTLDGVMRNLSNNDLMICDSQNSIAIAGVMGGKNSSITNDTKNIVLESAYFNSISVRKTSKRLQLSTDASQRFERGTDPNLTAKGLELAAELILEICPNAKIGKIIDVYPNKIKPIEIKLEVEKVESILGINISVDKILSYLNGIGIISSLDKNGNIKSIAPTHRPDILQWIDLVEEIARLFGYDNIPNTENTRITFSSKKEIEQYDQKIKNYLSSIGLNEVMTNSFIPEKYISIANEKCVKLLNPISEELSYLRNSLIPSICEVLKYNINYGSKNLKMFEYGKIYFKENENQQGLFLKNYNEENQFIIALTGNATEKNIYENEREFDIFDLKGIVELIFNKFLLDKANIISYDVNENEEIIAKLNETKVAKIFKLSDEVVKKFDIGQKVYVSEIYFDKIVFQSLSDKKYVEKSKYPKIVRDIAIILDTKYTFKEIEKFVKSFKITELINFNLFDLFEGEAIGKGKKSFAFRLEFQSDERTLKESEVEKVLNKITEGLKIKFNAQLRAE